MDTYQSQPWPNIPRTFSKVNLVAAVARTGFSLDTVAHHFVYMRSVFGELPYKCSVVLPLDFELPLDLVQLSDGVFYYSALFGDFLVIFHHHPC